MCIPPNSGGSDESLSGSSNGLTRAPRVPLHVLSTVRVAFTGSPQQSRCTPPIRRGCIETLRIPPNSGGGAESTQPTLSGHDSRCARAIACVTYPSPCHLWLGHLHGVRARYISLQGYKAHGPSLPPWVRHAASLPPWVRRTAHLLSNSSHLSL